MNVFTICGDQGYGYSLLSPIAPHSSLQLSYSDLDQAFVQYDRNAMHVCDSFTANARRIDAAQSYVSALMTRRGEGAGAVGVPTASWPCTVFQGIP